MATLRTCMAWVVALAWFASWASTASWAEDDATPAETAADVGAAKDRESNLKVSERPPTAGKSVLYLSDGDFFTGELQDTADAGLVRWQSHGAAMPFTFPAAAVRAAFFPLPEQLAPANAEYCFELSGGDRLFGSLTSFTPDVVEVESEQFGKLSIERSHIRRIIPWHGSTSWEYSGPNSLADWKHMPNKNGWLEEAGHLLTEAPSASLRRQLKIPKQAIIELAISWNKKLDFMFVLARGSDKKSESEGVHLEVWDQTLVLVRESRDDADLATICDLKAAKNRLHLQLLIDQQKGMIAVHSLDGSKLGEINTDDEEAEPLEWIMVRNHRGDVRLEQIIVSKWSGQAPAQVDVSRPRIPKTDGDVVYGEVVRFEPQLGQFVVRDETGATTVMAGEISSVVVSTDAPSAAGSVRVGCHDGTRLSGDLNQVQDQRLFVTRVGIQQPLVFALDNVRCVIGSPSAAADAPMQGPFGRLELDGVRSHGSLVDGKADEAASCLVWQPRQSTTSSPLLHDVSGRIVYRDPPPAPRRTPEQVEQQRRLQQQRAQRVGVWGAVVNAFSGGKENATARPPRMNGYPHAIYLLAGDRIPCIVSRIDDAGVHFSSSVVETGVIPHAKIKALELVPFTAAATLAEAKLRRLLTLPRMQRNNPPTHLIASTRGDYLRARLQSMDGQTLVAETRLESKPIARGRIATIIWLHPTNGENSDAEVAETSNSPMQVQAIRADGVRLTFVPHEVANNTLLGSSSLLGSCKVEVKAVDRLLLGTMIEESTNETIYDVWHLTDAIDPKYVQDDGSSVAAPAGMNSPLIGKPAPEIQLNLLGGGQFQLSNEKGHVVVLDFWASWCPHCMQGMPEITRVVDEFFDENVKYVAVNMQEDTATIASALERIQQNPIVALDIDGAVAEHYEVSALPQLVLVDADGNVARMFIGVDTDFAEQLRQALRELVESGAAASASETGGE